MTSDMQISRRDSEVLCSLSGQVAEIAALPVQEEKRRLWTALDSLKPVRPLVDICQEPWREIEGIGYILHCEGELARQLESQLRRRLWRWEHAPADDPVEAAVGVQAVYEETPWGLPLPPRRPDGKIPRLRRVSMSPWVDWEEGAAAIGRDFVYSAKPNPALLVGGRWEPGSAREQLKQILRATHKHGCGLEIVLKDIHTLRHEPKSLAEWEHMTMELVNDTDQWS